MFGCVIDTFGFTDLFTKVENQYSLDIPPINQINHISIFVYEQQQLGNVAYQVSIINGNEELKLGFLTDFQPAITFTSPKVPSQNSAKLILTLCNYDEVFVQTEHLLTQEEDAMINFQSERMLKNFEEHLKQKTVQHEDKYYFPLLQIKKWKDQYIQYLYNTK